MLRRCGCFLLVSLLLCLPSRGLAENATCPYDVEGAARMMPVECYANATNPSATSCCWFVFGAYIYAAARHANLTDEAFLPPPVANACSSSFSSLLIRDGLVRPSLLLSNTCSLSGASVPLAAAGQPCEFPTVSSIRSTVNVSLATRDCASDPRLDLYNNQSACDNCQNDVIAIVFSLLNITNSKEIVPCGMAATIAIWAGYNPGIARFRSFVLCMVQTLENVGGLATGFLLPSPPPAASTTTAISTPSSNSSSKTITIAASSAAAAAVLLIVIVSLLLRHQNRKSTAITTLSSDRDAINKALSPLPTEGLYIFTTSELRQATNGYDEKLVLGEGGAGKVYLGTLPSRQRVAIKRIYREKKLDEFYKEVEILAKIRHKNLTTLVGYCLGDCEHALVYEYMAGGNLSTALYHGELSWRQRLGIAAEVAEGLVYLHGFPEGAVIHRDVKPSNVLLAEGWAQAKVSDFGVSRVVPGGEDATHLTTDVRGTRGYVDPESFAVGHVSEATDVYSFGVVLLELVTGMPAVVPTPSGGAESIVNTACAAVAAVRGVEPLVDSRLGPAWDRASVSEVFETAIKCVAPNKVHRPRMSEVLAVLRRALADLEARMVSWVDVESSSQSIETADQTVALFSTPTTSNPNSSSPEIHAWSL